MVKIKNNYKYIFLSILFCYNYIYNHITTILLNFYQSKIIINSDNCFKLKNYNYTIITLSVSVNIFLIIESEKS